MSIPRIIHQIWISNKGSTPCSEELVCQKRFIELNPGWEYRFHTDFDILPIFTDPEKLEKFKKYGSQPGASHHVNSFLADACKLIYMFIWGGVYSDLDMYWLKPLDEVLDKYNNDSIHLYETGESGTRVGEHLYISPAGQSFWLEMLEQFIDLTHATPVQPYAALHRYTKNRNNLIVHPTSTSYPVSRNEGNLRYRVYPDTICTHIWKGKYEYDFSRFLPENA
jgi:mannosyltransferase OCH1-like enzyme